MIIGLDEAGRGAYAGPLLAAAVVWPDWAKTPGLADSKRLTAGQRQRLAVVIKNRAESIGLGWVTASEIDQLGLGPANRLAMERAWRQLSNPGCPVIIDGPINYLTKVPKAVALVRADSQVAAVMAAGIVAKVERDQFMVDLGKIHPEYGFAANKGYGTNQHQVALEKYGSLPGVHRRSYRPLQVVRERENPRRATV